MKRVVFASKNYVHKYAHMYYNILFCIICMYINVYGHLIFIFHRMALQKLIGCVSIGIISITSIELIFNLFKPLDLSNIRFEIVYFIYSAPTIWKLITLFGWGRWLGGIRGWWHGSERSGSRGSKHYQFYCKYVCIVLYINL